MDIVFNYEYDCGGDAYTKSVEISKEEFENDNLLILVCAYMQTFCGYPGKTIDIYLHNRFPYEHTLDDMLYGRGIYNVYSCAVDGLKDFDKIAYGILGLTVGEAEEWMEAECEKYNEQFKFEEEEGFSIWN